MAWRPDHCLLRGELDNTVQGKVTGWLQFASLKQKVALELEGNFHRDIRGATIRFRGRGRKGDPDAARYLKGFCLTQTGEVGDITAGLPPYDYLKEPYIEWYSTENGRVVLEPGRGNVEVIGRPIPAIESDPISREEQERKLLNFMENVSAAPVQRAVTVAPRKSNRSDPAFSHWVVVEGVTVGEAHSVEACEDGMCFAHVRLFAMPDMAEYGLIPEAHLRKKS